MTMTDLLGAFLGAFLGAAIVSAAWAIAYWWLLRKYWWIKEASYDLEENRNALAAVIGESNGTIARLRAEHAAMWRYVQAEGGFERGEHKGDKEWRRLAKALCLAWEAIPDHLKQPPTGGEP